MPFLGGVVRGDGVRREVDEGGLWGWKLGLNGLWVGDCVFMSGMFGFTLAVRQMALVLELFAPQ